jgi:hypothetical protein
MYKARLERRPSAAERAAMGEWGQKKKKQEIVSRGSKTWYGRVPEPKTFSNKTSARQDFKSTWRPVASNKKIKFET